MPKDSIISWPITANYAFGYLLFMASSDEHILQSKSLMKRNKKIFSSKNSVLDIGPADGDLSYMLFSDVKKIVAYEPNYYLSQLFCHKFSTHKNFVLYDLPWNETSYSSRLYDVVNLQHVLYHIDNDHIIKYLENVMGFLRKDGVVIISLWSESSELYSISNDFGKVKDWFLTAENFYSLISCSSLKSFLSDQYLLSPLVRPVRDDISNIILSFLVGGLDFSAFDKDCDSYIKRLSVGLYNHQSVFILKG